MAIEKDRHYLIPTCDWCGMQLNYSDGEPFDDFDEAVRFMKANGWSSSKNEHDEWENYCPECQTRIRQQSAVNDFKGITQ